MKRYVLNLDTSKTVELDPYEVLANAIVEQAAKDYRKARKDLKIYHKDEKAKGTITEVERFFHSSWFRVLTKADPEYILTMLKEER